MSACSNLPLLLTFISMSTGDPAWDEYSTAHHCMYSETHFHSLSFDKVLTLAYPEIAPPSFVHSYIWLDEIPITSCVTLIMPGDIIPHIQDLQPILDQMQEQYKQGRYGDELIYADEFGTPISVAYHFSKVRLVIYYLVLFTELELIQIHLFRHINNYQENFMWACELFQHVQHRGLLLDNDLETLHQQGFLSFIPGFTSNLV
jgi:hypothetical protein